MAKVELEPGFMLYLGEGPILAGQLFGSSSPQPSLSPFKLGEAWRLLPFRLDGVCIEQEAKAQEVS